MSSNKISFGLSKTIGIDLGTANTLVHLSGKGIIINEPTVVAIDANDKKVLAIGDKADEMLGRTPENIVAVRPLKDGVIADFEITRAMIKSLVKKAVGNKGGIFKPRILVCVPAGVTDVEKRAVEEAALVSGVKSVSLIEEPMAAAMGAGLPVDKPVGSMIVDIGGGTTEVAIISLGGIVTSKSIKVAGDALNAAVMNFIKHEYSLCIGEKMAEEIKISIGSAMQYNDEGYFDVKGRDLLQGIPANVKISSSQVRDAMSECIYKIVDAIRETLEKTPPELASDIMNYGITITGGGALIRNIDNLIYQMIGIPVRIAEEPLNCVAIGAGLAAQNEVVLKRSLFRR